jgi:hypothetical protein
MIIQPGSPRSDALRRFVSTILIATLMSALTTSVGAQSAPQAPEQVAQPQPAPPPASDNAGLAAPPPAGYSGLAAQPAPGTTYAPAPGAPYAPPPGAPYYQGAEMYRPRPRISKGMLIGGSITLGVSYLVSATIGLALIDQPRYECIDCKDVAPWLIVPVIGPFIGAGQAAGGEAVIALLGVAQLAGLGLLIGGIIRYKNTKRRAMEQGYAFELRHNRSLALDVASTPRFSGPQLNLRF